MSLSSFIVCLIGLTLTEDGTTIMMKTEKNLKSERFCQFFNF